MRQRVALDHTPITVLNPEEVDQDRERVPRVLCDLCGQLQPTMDGFNPISHGRQRADGRIEPCR